MTAFLYVLALLSIIAFSALAAWALMNGSLTFFALGCGGGVLSVGAGIRLAAMLGAAVRNDNP